MRGELEVGIRVEGGVPVAEVVGEIDGKTAPRLQAAVLPVVAEAGRVVLDMRGVTYLSSAGLRALLLVYRNVVARDGRVVLVGLAEPIRDIMAVTGFLRYFAVAGTVEEGLEAVR